VSGLSGMSHSCVRQCASQNSSAGWHAGPGDPGPAARASTATCACSSHPALLFWLARWTTRLELNPDRPDAPAPPFQGGAPGARCALSDWMRPLPHCPMATAPAGSTSGSTRAAQTGRAGQSAQSAQCGQSATCRCLRRRPCCTCMRLLMSKQRVQEDMVSDMHLLLPETPNDRTMLHFNASQAALQKPHQRVACADAQAACIARREALWTWHVMKCILSCSTAAQARLGACS
jgi:hypothetical protein